MSLPLLNNRYRIIQALGTGGFGNTFLAEDTHMPSGRRCVIKQLRPITHNPQVYELVQQRFGREAAILEELGEGSRQIPKLYAYFYEQEQFYLVQEWIDGSTLKHKVQQQGKLSEGEVQAILISLLSVLDYIHSRHIIHRDIKPDNIMLRAGDRLPVLIDFGAVKEAMGTVLNSQGNTTGSIVIGTPGFMPAEQAAGRPLYSSDLYSLGLTAIYLLTGKLPQELETESTTGELAWRQDNPSISVLLATILDRAIRFHPRDRFPTARAMLDALQTGILPEPVQASVGEVTALPPSQISPPPSEKLPSPELQQTLLSPHKDWNQSVFTGAAIGSLLGLVVIGGFLLAGTPRPFLSLRLLPTPPLSNEDFSWLSQRAVTEADLKGKNAFELDVMRNSIYARHGRRFNSRELQAYFDRQPWYRPRYSPEEFPEYAVSSLEVENAVYILNYQKRYGLRWVQ